MFVQVIQGRAKESEALRRQWETWDQQLKPSARGFLGGTAGVTADGEFIALVRFEDEAAARANSDRAEQGDWWTETSQHLDEPMFHDCALVELVNDGGSDDAGFVQVIQGKVTDIDRAREIDRAMQDDLRRLRPDVIGGIVAWHPRDGRFTNAMYFTSEADARANERESSDAAEFEQYMSEYQAISDGDPEYLDITDPWYSSP
ncbi:MAG: hypothetical protein KY460_08865 [Actinobacteria bacterium]|nr:hypothetical protein [Actinomycetota bacterium]